MPENGHLNGSQDGGAKGYSWTLKMEFPGFPRFGLCRWRGGSQSQTSCTEIISGVFWPKFGAKKDHITWWMRPADNRALVGGALSMKISISITIPT